jgi:hypothetical protein
MTDILSAILSSSFRPALEVLALVLGAALVGFLVARAMYRTKVATRTDHLRLEQTRWRRRLSHSSSSIVAVVSERDRSQRKLRRAQADRIGAKQTGSAEKSVAS